jgi:hypothetical protein
MEAKQHTRDWAYVAVVLGCLAMAAGGMVYHRLFIGIGTAKLMVHLALWASVAGLAALLRTWREWLADVTFAMAVMAYLFFRWPDMFFDDAGFILRYLDQVPDGYWFHYNGGEGPVFGISGFLHGLVCSVWVALGLDSNHALVLSNAGGVMLGGLFLSALFREVIQLPFLAYLMAGSTILLSKFYCNVAFTGMEMPLHVALILGAGLFLIRGKSWPFFIFSALSIVSKLDAVPIVAVFIAIHLLRQFMDYGLGLGFKRVVVPMVSGFGIPLAAWILFANLYFGSALPQSAQAKLLYHSGQIQSWFPFLEWLLEEPYKRIQIGILLLTGVVQAWYWRRTAGRSLMEYWALGWAFLGVLALYYVYNPNERMMWYYSLPDILLTGQCLLSLAWLGSQAFNSGAFTLPYASACLAILFLKPSVDGGRKWLEQHALRIEEERTQLGLKVASLADDSDTLLAWHGLISRPFPGFVLDGTGLNSKMAVAFALDCGRMVEGVNSDFGVHHGHQELLDCFGDRGYAIRLMSGDIALDGNPVWVVWQRPESVQGKRTARLLDGKLFQNGLVREVPLHAAGGVLEMKLPAFKERNAILWFTLERMANPRSCEITIWKGAEELKKEILLMEALNSQSGSAGSMTQSFGWPLPSGLDTLKGQDLSVRLRLVESKDSLHLHQPILELWD